MKTTNKILIIGVVLIGTALFIYYKTKQFFKEDEFMVTFIATKIEEAAEISLENGQAKYRAYFVRKSAKRLYGKYQEDVNTILSTDDCADVIVEE